MYVARGRKIDLRKYADVNPRNVVLSTSTNDIKWGTVCQELRSMYCLQADIVCGDANQAWYFIFRTHKTQRTDTIGKTFTQNLAID